MAGIQNNISSYYASLYNRLYSGSSSLSGTGSQSGYLNPVKTYNPVSDRTTNRIDTTMQSYIGDIRKGALSLKSTMADLTSRSNSSPFRAKTLVSSDLESVSGSYIPGALGTKATAVRVNQLASGQVNEASLDAKMAAGIAGYQQFQIDVGGKSHQVSFSVNAGETNETMQRNLAAAVNKLNIGVKASVSVENGKSALSLTATNTGSGGQASFSVKDLFGGAVAASGISAVKREAQDASFTVNGAARTSKSNTADLGNGISVTLKKAGGSEVTLTPSVDTDATASEAKSLVESFNGLLTTADSNAGAYGANKLSKELSGISKTYANSLSRIGITVNSKGYLSLNETKLAEAVKNGTAESFFTGNGVSSSYGFANRLAKTAADASRSPAQYAGGVGLSYTNTKNAFLDTSLLFNFMI